MKAAPNKTMAADGPVPPAAARPRHMNTVRLPNGLSVRYVSKRDVLFLYNEVYSRRCYLRHGISLPRGGSVIDCGANIGLFSMLAAEKLGPEGIVVACEPLPAIYDCLQHNIVSHTDWWRQCELCMERDLLVPCVPASEAVVAAAPATTSASAAGAGGSVSAATRRSLQPAKRGNSQRQQHAQQLGEHWRRQSAGSLPAPIVPLAVGVGGQDGTATFTFYPRAAGWSTMLPADSREIEADMDAFLDQALSSREAASQAGLDPFAASLGVWLYGNAPAWLYGAAWRTAVRVLLGGAVQVSRPLVTVSQLIDRHELEAVDLLKVDVERAELGVLRGIEDPASNHGRGIPPADRHWPLVRQAALEVHTSALEEVLGVLQGKGGFPAAHIVVEQDVTLQGSSLHAVYCWR